MIVRSRGCIDVYKYGPNPQAGAEERAKHKATAQMRKEFKERHAMSSSECDTVWAAKFASMRVKLGLPALAKPHVCRIQ